MAEAEDGLEVKKTSKPCLLEKVIPKKNLLKWKSLR
jgi:hypothetical protein